MLAATNITAKYKSPLVTYKAAIIRRLRPYTLNIKLTIAFVSELWGLYPIVKIAALAKGARLNYNENYPLQRQFGSLGYR